VNSAGFQATFDAVDFDAWRERSLATGPAEVAAALRGSSRGLERMAALLSPRAADEALEDMAALAHRITVQRFGRILQMYAPLYVSNECIDTCTYCGFSREHPVRRITLKAEEAAREAELLHAQGFRHVLLVSGEHPRIVSTGYLASVVRRLRDRFASVAIEVAPQSEEGYRELVDAGVDALTVYQETYDREVYARVHLAGRKKNFDWRLATPERAARAGMKRINIGALFGLADWRRDALATWLHADWMQKVLWRTQVSVSMPRLQGAIGAITAPQPVDDRSLVQFVCAMRICLPDVGLVLSTREPRHLRDGLVRLGITQLSAGSQTEPGGYENPSEDAEQFEVADERSPEDVARELRAMGYEVVWKDWEPSLHGSSVVQTGEARA
jgi:2-iminoacetate synthase